VPAEVDERFVSQLAVGHEAIVTGCGQGCQDFFGHVTLVKPVMGKKTIFTHDAAERKNLDVIQVLIDLPEDLSAPLALQVEVAIHVTSV
jgi:hypothetical protein